MRYLEEVVTLSFDPARCQGCGFCVDVCPHRVFALKHKRARLIDRGACMECGACALNCEHGAIEVRSGVGCAAAVISGAAKGTQPTCDCSGSSCC